MIRNRRSLTDHGNETAREQLLDIAVEAIDRVHPRGTVPAVLQRDGDVLRIEDREYDLSEIDNVYLVGAGKGSGAVAEALLEYVGDHTTDGIVAEKAVQEGTLTAVDDAIDVVEAGHPIPDETSAAAGRRTLELAETTGEDDLVFACITGGASAQLIAPAEGLTVTDLAETTRVLLEAGLRIEEINAVRKRLSKLKGGRLAERLAPAEIVSLIVVDEVAGDPWGPTIGDGTTLENARDVIDRYGLEDRLPDRVVDRLTGDRRRRSLETPTPADLSELGTQIVVLARAADACEAARDAAASRGYEPLVLSTSIEGESREVATVLAGIAREVREFGRPVPPPCVLISGGETTVTVRENAGTGGPNQEYALRTAIEIEGQSGVTALALGTDGTDGPTPVAGGLVDSSTRSRLETAGIDPHARLDSNDATPALEAVDDAVDTGPTWTNVMDLRLTLVETEDCSE